MTMKPGSASSSCRWVQLCSCMCLLTGSYWSWQTLTVQNSEQVKSGNYCCRSLQKFLSSCLPSRNVKVTTYKIIILCPSYSVIGPAFVSWSSAGPGNKKTWKHVGGKKMYIHKHKTNVCKVWYCPTHDSECKSWLINDNGHIAETVACSAECDRVAFCRACNTHRVTQKNGNLWNA